MKMKRFSALIMASICVFLLACPVLAADTRASNQINTYTVDVTPSSGNLAVDFYVYANSTMTKIGCSSIKVYQKSGSSWSLQASKSESASGMTKTNANSIAKTMNFNGASGVSYKVVVTVFAENSAGRDSRTVTRYVTGK